MTHLIKWQLISMISRFTAMGIGIAQGIFVVRLLSTADYGLVGVVTAVGSLAGILMHLGLVSGATREIAAAAGKGESHPLDEVERPALRNCQTSESDSLRRKESDSFPDSGELPASERLEGVFKIFISALLARIAVALPIFLVLFWGAPVLAGNVYHHPEITTAVRLYALVLLVQAPQGIFDAALSGLKQFKSVFIFQVVIALVSLLLHVPLIWRFQFYGYFWAMLALAVVHTMVLCFLIWRTFCLSVSERVQPARGGLNPVGKLSTGQENSKFEALNSKQIPMTKIQNYKQFGTFGFGILKLFRISDFGFRISVADVKANLYKILSVGLSLYVVKIIFTLWQRFGPLVLGRAASATEVGIFNFALFYSTKLMTASDAITDVNLPFFSGKFDKGLVEFKKLFLANFQKIYAFITLAAVSAIYWSPELVRLVVGHKYDDSLRLIPWLVGAFWCYSFINIIKSSLLVPARLNRDMIVSYSLLLLGTVGGYYGFGFSLRCHPELVSGSDTAVLGAMALGMLAGGILALAYQWFALRRTLSLNILTRRTLTLTFLLTPLIIPYGLSFGLWFKLAIFIVDLGLFIYLLDHFQILPWKWVLVCGPIVSWLKNLFTRE